MGCSAVLRSLAFSALGIIVSYLFLNFYVHTGRFSLIFKVLLSNTSLGNIMDARVKSLKPRCACTGVALWLNDPPDMVQNIQ